MQTIIMTVGTSLRTNSDRDLPNEQKRPWVTNKNKFEDQRIFNSIDQPLTWMKTAELELISAETNTLWRLDPDKNDRILLLHSATPSGQECAEVLQNYFKTCLEQNYVDIEPIPDINYELDESGSALEQMASLLRERIQQADGIVTLAATGGFKAQTMVMGLVGNALGVPVCYIHEAYKALVYLPYINTSGQPEGRVQRNYGSKLPESGRSRNPVIQVQGEKQGHHRPKSWKKVEKILQDLPWVDLVRFDAQAFSAPKNGVKGSPRDLDDGRKVLWLHLHESDQSHIAVSIETTGYTPEHLKAAATELRERLGRIF
ncbi:putative CRISPR-associated protein [Spirulina subsalsa FACHB-351]|uniref:CRISPR-associated protein n=1 Tax=Spirulina subsalsa FACHB-351 TaxID=234711 RepID=A0ABT3L214_9CYAN|nr:putative CRISPR-associated protein [Spirulina subsalsa]MCW6035548.1 putative CRISPR-associated protein [Spirulina subsalsa FACHB-351]